MSLYLEVSSQIGTITSAENVIILEVSGSQGPTGATGAAGSDATVNEANVTPVVSGLGTSTSLVDGDLFNFINNLGVWVDITWVNIYGSLRSVLGFIRGQYDPWQSFTPSNNDTVTLDYSVSNSAQIDISALGTGDTITLAASNWSSSANNGMMTLVIKTGADPDVTINYLTGMTPPTLVASKENWFNIALNLDGDGYHLMSAGDF